MRKIHLHDFNGQKIGNVDLPEEPHEIRMEQMINFVKALEKIYEEYAQRTTKVEPLVYLAQHIEVLSEFFDQDKDLFMNLNLGKLNPDEAVELDGTVMGMITYLRALMDYKPKLRDERTFKYEHKGEEFEIPYFRASAFLKDRLNRPDLKVGEVTELMEIHRLKGVEMENDPTGSHWYTRDVFSLACLSRKRGEELPEDPARLKSWLMDRMYFLADIDMVTCLDAAFFFRNITRTWHVRNHSGSFSTLRIPGLTISTVWKRWKELGKRMS